VIRQPTRAKARARHDVIVTFGTYVRMILDKQALLLAPHFEPPATFSQPDESPKHTLRLHGLV